MPRGKRASRRGILPERWDPRRRLPEQEDGADEYALDVSDAVLLDGTVVSRVNASRAGEEAGEGATVALELSGRVNGTEDRVALLFLMPPAGFAAIVTAGLDAAERGIPEIAEALARRLGDIPR